MLTFLAFIFVFGIVVLAHELGHFLVAKAVGIRADEFGLGFGKRLLAYRYGETTYTLNLIPLGGYVKLAGMDGDENNNQAENYHTKTVWQKIAVIASGPLMNFILALVLFFLIFSCYGIPTKVAQTTEIGDVMIGYPAEQAGLQAGDQITAVNDQPVKKWAQITGFIHAHPKQQIEITVLRDGQTINKKLIPKYDEKSKVGLIGITPEIISEKLGLWASLKVAFLQTAGITVAIVVGLFQMITGQISSDVSGPIGIAQMAGQAAKVGWEQVFQLTAILSVNLGLFNLLPIPALDGGRLFFLGVEAVRGKAIEPKKEGMVHFFGFVLLLFILLVVTYQDVLKFMIN